MNTVMDIANRHQSMGQHHEDALDFVVPRSTLFADESIPCQHETHIDIAVG